MAKDHSVILLARGISPHVARLNAPNPYANNRILSFQCIHRCHMGGEPESHLPFTMKNTVLLSLHYSFQTG
jgi:hypothetical protein